MRTHVRRAAYLLGAAVALTGVVAWMAHASGQPGGDSSPIYGVKIPAGYRDWQLIAVKQLHFGGRVLLSSAGPPTQRRPLSKGTKPVVPTRRKARRVGQPFSWWCEELKFG